jgi:transaldolase/glucose-6-phosphate isomerase
MESQLNLSLGKFQDQVDQRMDRWEAQQFARRMWTKDPTLWFPDPQPGITDRLGWLALPERMQDKCEDILSFSHRIKEEGFSHVLLLGMGGSSLAPEVFQKTMGNAPGFPELIVLDCTHPAAIIDVEKKLDPANTLVLVSSKSGTTLETLSLFRYFWTWVSKNHNKPGRCFVAITDEGSSLEGLAREKKFRRTFLPSPDVGGRYSAFTEFGLVPAALIGMDVQRLLEKGRIAEKKSLGFILGATLGELAPQRDKLTIWTTSSLAGFPSWLEQLIAESTGKKGKGIVPVVDEPFAPTEIYGQDRVFVGIFLEQENSHDLEGRLRKLEVSGNPTIRIDLKEKLDIGMEIFRWEIATASAGAVLGIHPFNQPDVQLAKDLTRLAMEKSGKATETAQDPLRELSIEEEHASACALESLLLTAKPGDYIAMQAYLPPSTEITLSLQDLREALLKHSRLATTLGFGPRFLHSTGQLHKGGPNTVLAIQITDVPEQDLRVPETDYTFAALIEAQAQGDYRALQQNKRRTLRITLGRDVIGGLKKLAGFFS